MIRGHMCLLDVHVTLQLMKSTVHRFPVVIAVIKALNQTPELDVIS